MLNIDTRLLELIDESEIWLLLHLAKRLGKQEESVFPSNATLLAETGWHIEKLQRVKKSLEQKNILKIKQRKIKGQKQQSSNVYIFKTDKISYFTNAKGEEVEVSSPIGFSGGEGVGKSEGGDTGKSDREVLTTEVLTTEEEYSVLSLLDEIKTSLSGKKAVTHMTAERMRLIKTRKADFLKIWPAKNFVNGFKYMAQYKGKEWFGTEMWKNFKIETILGQKHFVKYVEEAIENKGVPPTGGKTEPKVVAKSAFKNMDRFNEER